MPNEIPIFRPAVRVSPTAVTFSGGAEIGYYPAASAPRTAVVLPTGERPFYPTADPYGGTAEPFNTRAAANHSPEIAARTIAERFHTIATMLFRAAQAVPLPAVSVNREATVWCNTAATLFDYGWTYLVEGNSFINA